MYFQVIWKNEEYSYGGGYKSRNGKFIAPRLGIYFFNAQGRTCGGHAANIYFYLNGSRKTIANRDEYRDCDNVTATAQFKMSKGDTVTVYFEGRFYDPTRSEHAYFEGHLIDQVDPIVKR